MSPPSSFMLVTLNPYLVLFETGTTYLTYFWDGRLTILNQKENNYSEKER